MTGKQAKVLQALLTCPTQAAAAKAAGVGLTTLKRYLSDDGFQREYRKAVSELIADAAQRGRQSMIGAMDALRTVMDDESQSGQTRVQAARSILEFSLRLDERENVLKRLDQLEEAAMRGGDL